MSEWIKCSERMPERGKTVLVACVGSWCGPIALAKRYPFGEWGLHQNGEGDSLYDDEVTHWMPLPPLP